MIGVAHDRRAVARQMLLERRASDDLERRAVDETLALLDGASDPFARTTLPGHVTGSAIVLDHTRTRVLVVWHMALQRWLQPGGHSEPDDESPLATAIRELGEETGLAIDRAAAGGRLVHVDVHGIPARGTIPAHRHHDLRFAFAAPSQVAAARTAEHSATWVEIGTLGANGGDASLRTAVECALREVG